MRLTDEQLAREYATWDDETVLEHFRASREMARQQRLLGDRETAVAAQRCRQTAERFSRELARRAKEQP